MVFNDPYPSLPEVIEQSEVIRCDPNSLAELRRMFASIGTMLKHPLHDFEPWIYEEIRYTIPIMLIQMLASAQEITNERPGRMRDNVIKQIKGFLNTSTDMAPKVRDLCSRFHVSERTLEYAFREHFGVTPKGYIKTFKLNQVRKALRQKPKQAVKIADIANQFGFCHMGQFATDYRKLFGELPSATFHKQH